MEHAPQAEWDELKRILGFKLIEANEVCQPCFYCKFIDELMRMMSP
jgi:hypothetical protein